MTKVLPRKPGPKSSKESKIVAARGTLGETSCDSNGDDSSAEYTDETTKKTPQNKPQTNVNNSEFRTPDVENDATDYGLEFTTSQIPNPSPRRCSTLRSVAGSSNEKEPREQNSEKTKTSASESDTPKSTLPKSTVKSKPPKKVTQPKPTTSKSKENTTPSQPVATQPTKTRRKQRTPLQLEKRFWNDVRILQNRTNNLIPMRPFSRLIREIMQDSSAVVTKITPTALEALQTSSEMYLTQRLQDAYMLTLHRNRVTLDVRDLQLINFLKVNFQ